jgi:hypothetical protein
MTVRHNLLRFSAGALALGTTVAIAPAAMAESAPLTYNCSTVLGPTSMPVVVDTDLPAVAHVGDTLPVNMTSDVTVPASMMGLVYGLLGGRFAEGTAIANGVVSGPSGDVPTATDMVVPKTAIPATGDLLIQSTGTAPDFVPTEPGIYTITAGDFTSKLSFLKADGVTDSGLGVQTIPCTAPTGVSTLVDTVTVTYATSVELSVPSTPYGKAATATATIVTDGAAPSGTVVFTVGDDTIEAPVTDGTATAPLPVLPAGTRAVTATYTPSTADYDASEATQDWTVTRAATHTTAKAVKGTLRVHRHGKFNVAVSSADATAQGKVTLVLKHAGKTFATKTVALRDGDATVRLAKAFKKAGAYKLIAKYSGDENFSASKTAKKIRVRG